MVKTANVTQSGRCGRREKAVGDFRAASKQPKRSNGHVIEWEKQKNLTTISTHFGGGIVTETNHSGQKLATNE